MTMYSSDFVNSKGAYNRDSRCILKLDYGHLMNRASLIIELNIWKTGPSLEVSFHE